MTGIHQVSFLSQFLIRTEPLFVSHVICNRIYAVGYLFKMSAVNLCVSDTILPGSRDFYSEDI